MPTYEEAITALRNADAASDTQAAQRLAGIAARLRDQGAPAPAAAPAGPPEGFVEHFNPNTGAVDVVRKPAPPPTPTAAEGVMGALRKGYGAVEAATTTATGATTGFLGGLLGAANNIAARVGRAVTGNDTAELPSTGQAFEQGMQALTYTPRLEEGQQYAEKTGEVLNEVGTPLLGLGPEMAALSRGVGMAARPTAAAVQQGARAVKAAPVKAVAALTPGISPESAAVVRKAAAFGIDIPPDALSKNKFVKLAGEASRNVPLSGAGSEANAAAFNSALARRIGAVDAAGKPVAKIPPKVFDDAITQSGETIGRITAENPIPLDAVQPTVDSLRKAAKSRSGGVADAVEGYLKDIEAKAAENEGVVPGTAMKEILGQLGRDARSAADGPVRNALGELHRALTGDVAKVIGPEDAAALLKARQQYSDALTIAPLIRPDGNVSPAGFNQAFRAGRAGKMRAARGIGGELGDLAEVAQYMREPGSSLTAERGLTYAALGGAAKIEPHTAAATAVGANLYNRMGPAVMREKAGAVKAPRGQAPGKGAPPAPAGEPPAGAPPAPAGGGPAAPGGAAADPRLVSIEEARKTASSDAVRAALDEHEKTVRKTIATEQAAAKQAADVDALEAAAKATQDPELRKTLQVKADKLRGEKIPVGEATELATTPTPKPEKVGKIPVGKVIEGAPPEPPAPKTEPIPAGEATELAPEVIAPVEPIPAGEAAPLPSNRPAGEVVSNVPQAEPVSNVPAGEAPAPVSNIPKAEPNAQVPDYTHGALFKAAELAGIETRGRRPSEVRAAFEASWAKEHGLSPFDAERAKATAKALEIDEKAVEAAAVQHEKSPRAFDRAVDKIIERGTPNEAETKPAAQGGQSPATEQTPPGRTAGAAAAAGERAGANGPAAPRANAEGAATGGPSEARGVKSVMPRHTESGLLRYSFERSDGVDVSVAVSPPGHRKGVKGYEVTIDRTGGPLDEKGRPAFWPTTTIGKFRSEAAAIEAAQKTVAEHGAKAIPPGAKGFKKSAAKPEPKPEPVTTKDKQGNPYTVSVKPEAFGADKNSKSVLVEARDPATGERRGFVDFAVRPDGVLVAENAKVAPDFKQRGIAEMMYKAARDAGHDIAPGRVQTDEGHAMVEALRRKGLINKEAEGKRFRAGDLDLAPIEGETIPGEKATRPEAKGFEKGKRRATP